MLVLSFELLKQDGLLIFDDYGWGDYPKGIDGFINVPIKKRLRYLKRVIKYLLENINGAVTQRGEISCFGEVVEVQTFFIK